MAQTRIEPRSVTAWHLALVGLVAAVVRLPLWLSTTHLTFDEGVFLASTDLANNGFAQYRDFFTSQGPLFIPMLQLGHLLGFGDPRGPRTVMVVSGVVIAIATYVAIAAMTTRARALGFSLLIAVSGSVMEAAGPVQSEGPALALGMAALVIVMKRHDAPGALIAGALAGAAVATKSLHIVPTVAMLALVLVFRRQWLHLAYASLAAFAVAVGSALLYGVERVWDQYVLFHLAKDNTTGLLENVSNLSRYLLESDLFLVLLGVASIFLIRRPGLTVSSVPRFDIPRWLPAAWLATTILLILGSTQVDPGFVRVVAIVAPPLALLVAVHTRIADVVIVGAVAVALVVQALTMDYRLEPTAETARVIAAVEAVEEGRLIVSDDPGLLWSAGRLSHPDTVDPSFARFATGYLTTEMVADALNDLETCAFLSTSGRFEANGVVPTALYEPAGPEGVYVREGC